MDHQRFGAIVRAIRIRSRLRQEDVAQRAGVSRAVVSRVERGSSGTVTVDTIERVVTALGARVELVARWHGAELPRLLDAAHAALAETVLRLITSVPGWICLPEVSFSIYGERGSIDLVGWHAARRMILIVELKTEIVDLQDLLTKLDRKRRLALRIARERGWDAASVSVWLAIGTSHANRLAVVRHDGLLRAALPQRGREISRWLRDPVRPMSGLSFVTYEPPGSTTRRPMGVRRVRYARKTPTRA